MLPLPVPLMLLSGLLSMLNGVSAMAPLSTKNPVNDLKFRPMKRVGEALPSSLWSNELTRSNNLPTNAWWENLVLGSGDGMNSNVVVLPYIVAIMSNRLCTIYPRLLAMDRQVQNVFDEINGYVALSAVESLGTHYVENYDDFSVTLRWGNSNQHTTSPIVHGMPYTTMIYYQTTPVVSAPINAENVRVDGNAVACNGERVTGSNFEMDFRPTDSTWKVYVPRATTFICSQSGGFRLQADRTYDNFPVRVAIVNNCTFGILFHCTTPGKPDNHQDYRALLDKYSDAIPIGGNVSWSVNGDTAKLVFSWRKFSTTSTPLLMFALAHQKASISSSQVVNYGSVGHRNLRGWNFAVVGDDWVFNEKLSPITWTAPRPIKSQYRQSIIDSLINRGNSSDQHYDPSLNFQLGVGDTYFSGKMYARMARVILIAEELGYTDVVKTMVARLKKYMTIWVTYDSAGLMIYDQTWGGFLSCGCLYDDCWGTCTPHCTNEYPNCPALTDPGMNFGNGYYNDHHFHYGYFIYAFAVVAKYDRSWAEQYKEQILLYVRDFANPSPNDPYFPTYRHKDWYNGHSWAGGIPLVGGQPYYNGRNQESTSESVNGYYAVALLGRATNWSGIEDLGRVLTATEIDAAQAYWHVRTNSDIYPREFTMHAIGILWSNLAQFQTWFGLNPYFVHGIQMMPFTPITETLLEKEWVKEGYNEFSSSCTSDPNCAVSGWLPLVTMDQAIFDSNSAFQQALNFPDAYYDNGQAGGNGNSRINTLYWIATRA